MASRFFPETPLVWVLADDRAGNVSQCLGVADALGLPYEVRRLEYTAAAALPNFFMGASFSGLTTDTRVNLTPPWPDLVIAAGRRTAPVARHIKDLNGGNTRLVQVMYPGDAGADAFDLIAVPAHDGLAPAQNRIVTLGTPVRVDRARLNEAGDAWRYAFSHLPRPWIALIVGGATKRRPFTPAMAQELGQRAAAMASGAGGALLVSTSRRTGEEATQSLVAALDDSGVEHILYRWGETGENPYLAYLALADALVVTGDSVSMVCEACATERPVYIFAPRGFVAHKHARLHKELYAKGYARPLDGAFETWQHPPLDAARLVADEIRRRFGL